MGLEENVTLTPTITVARLMLSCFKGVASGLLGSSKWLSDSYIVVDKANHLTNYSLTLFQM